ncbi:MAG: hypothetical protein HUU34_12480 [Saprospiraceae bacterium]|jgi:hypothetical protein|nr:hypothetical protein [Saprospiraceae bacterium]
MHARWITGLLALVFLIAGCHTNKSANGACRYRGEVQDFSGLDGCSLLIVTDKGEKLLPIEFAVTGANPAAGQLVQFDYEEVEAVSICMAEDKAVRITCWQVDKDSKPQAKECLDLTRIEDTPWLRDAVKTHRAVQVLKYPYRTNGWAYVLKGDNVFLYDCQGRLVCKSEGPDASQCLQRVEPGSRGVVIWQGEGPHQH